MRKTIIVMMVALSAIVLASCQDWLTIYPQTQVVEEDFWEDKNDLEGVRYAAYKQMCNTLESIVLWGDLRSDSYSLSTADQSTSTIQLYQEIREGRLDKDSAESYFDWGGFYTTINYCNKVLQHGPEVLSKDKQFTSSEWTQMQAEITALRALNYFYLIRAFKDVPYTTKVINKDTEVQCFSASNQLAVLDSLIVDVEGIKGRARNRFSSTQDTKGLITNAAIYALLSDMYLWRASLHEGRGLTTDTVRINNVAGSDEYTVSHSVTGDYQLCCDYADLAMEALADQMENSNGGFGSSRQTTVSYGLTNVNLIENTFDNFASGQEPRLTAYSSIFSTGNSDESIFELQFNTSDSRSNSVVTSQWGYGTSVHLAASDGALGAVYSSTERNRDSRMWFSAWSNVSTIGSTSYSSSLPGYYCFKWRDISVTMPSSATPTCGEIKVSMSAPSADSYRNWIVYRLSDVMLQKAEALAAMGESLEAMKYVDAIHRRWYCNDDQSSTQQPSTDVTGLTLSTVFSGSTTATLGNIPEPSANTTSEKYEIAVLNERQIEFLGEGKRWFDLVRYAERHAGGQDGTKDAREWSSERPIGNGAAGVSAMIDQFLKNEFSSNYSTLKNRIKNRYGLYNIIYYMEIKANEGMLEQNPVWNKNTYEQ